MLATAQITIRDDADVFISTIAPTTPVEDMLWLDTSVIPHRLKRWSGSAWVECGADVDLSAYYTKTEINTRFAQTDQAISAKADSSTVSSLGERIEQAEQKVTPEAITSAVTSAALYAYDKYYYTIVTQQFAQFASRNSKIALDTGNISAYYN